MNNINEQSISGPSTLMWCGRVCVCVFNIIMYILSLLRIIYSFFQRPHWIFNVKCNSFLKTFVWCWLYSFPLCLRLNLNLTQWSYPCSHWPLVWIYPTNTQWNIRLQTPSDICIKTSIKQILNRSQTFSWNQSCSTWKCSHAIFGWMRTKQGNAALRYVCLMCLLWNVKLYDGVWTHNVEWWAHRLPRISQGKQRF